MLWLDCYDLEAGLASLASGIGVNREALVQELNDYDEARFINCSEDPEAQMPREVLQRLGAELATTRFEGVYLFHGTRVFDPDGFQRRGLLPLDLMLDEVWEMLYGLAQDEFSREQWQEFKRSIEEEGAGGHDGELYRLKVVGADAELHHGPHAEVVRELFFHPEEVGSHDYLACPELVQDLARCFRSAYGIDLEARFRAATVPCLVKLRSERVMPGAIKAALWFAFSMLREGVPTRNACWGLDLEGESVPPEDVVDVEVVN
jgi:hypothetical protein